MSDLIHTSTPQTFDRLLEFGQHIFEATRSSKKSFNTIMKEYTDSKQFSNKFLIQIGYRENDFTFEEDCERFWVLIDRKLAKKFEETDAYVEISSTYHHSDHKKFVRCGYWTDWFHPQITDPIEIGLEMKFNDIELCHIRQIKAPESDKNM